MKLSKEEVEYVANLANLYLTEEEVECFKEQLSRIISYIEKLNELNTDNVEPTHHVVPLYNILREDEERESFPKEEILKNAPARKKDFFTVPRII